LSARRARLHNGMNSADPSAQPGDLLSIAVIGNDALIEVLPARPIQFAHACRSAGFDVVLPASWGDELVADATLRKLDTSQGGAAVFCVCPIVRHRLLATGVDLAPMLISTVAPSVAVARYARALYGNAVGRLVFIGNCPAATAPEFDARYSVEEFAELLRGRRIDVLAQPLVFDAILPPDRRRFVSLPGGCPSAEVLWQHGRERVLIGLEGDDLAIELAQHLLTRQRVLIDLSEALGCSCSGVTAVTPGHSARVAVMSLEPPRTSSPVVEPRLLPSLDAPIESATNTTPPAESSDPRSADTRMERSTLTRGQGADAKGVTRPPIAITPVQALASVRPPTSAPSVAPLEPSSRPVSPEEPSFRVHSAIATATPESSPSVPTTGVDWSPRSVRRDPVDAEFNRTTADEGRADVQAPQSGSQHTLLRAGSGSFPRVRVSAFRPSAMLPRAYMTRRRWTPHRVEKHEVRAVDGVSSQPEPETPLPPSVEAEALPEQVHQVRDGPPPLAVPEVYRPMGPPEAPQRQAQVRLPGSKTPRLKVRRPQRVAASVLVLAVLLALALYGVFRYLAG
jgi:iron only hydrogenase large subunit